MPRRKANYDLFSIFKIIDVAIQVLIYIIALVFVIFNLDANKNDGLDCFGDLSLTIFASVGIYQVLSFVFQLFSWLLFPAIYNTRFFYILYIAGVALLYTFLIGKDFSKDYGIVAVITLFIALHSIALYYLVISIRETKLIIYSERKKLRP